MRQLAKKYDKIAQTGESVKNWLEAKKTNAANQVRVTESSSEDNWGGWLIGLLISIVGAVFSLMWTSNRKMVDGVFKELPPDPYPTIGYVFFCAIPTFIALAIFSSVRANRETGQLRQQKREELDIVMKLDPFFLRAELIMEAIKSWVGRRDQYRAWYDAVTDELMPADEEAAERYQASLVHSHGVIVKAIKNFETALELTGRQEKYRQAHPELAGMASSTALADLVARLDAPVELPTKDPFLEPGIVLDTEAELASLGETELDERFKALEAAEAKGAPSSSAKT